MFCEERHVLRSERCFSGIPRVFSMFFGECEVLVVRRLLVVRRGCCRRRVAFFCEFSFINIPLVHQYSSGKPV